MTKGSSGLSDLIRSALAVYRVSHDEPGARGAGAPGRAGRSSGFHLPSFGAIVGTGRALPGDPEECEAAAPERDLR